MFVSAGPAAVHCLAGDSEGRLYSWGRNEVRQKIVVHSFDPGSRRVLDHER
jgi:alpha-tubulin suppressor-like RCC1 family protein